MTSQQTRLRRPALLVDSTLARAGGIITLGAGHTPGPAGATVCPAWTRWPEAEIHLAADRRCRPVTRILTPGQHGDCPQFIPLLNQLRIARRGKGRPRTRPGAAMAGKAYWSAANRAYLRKRGITAVIPVKEDREVFTFGAEQAGCGWDLAAGRRAPVGPRGWRGI